MIDHSIPPQAIADRMRAMADEFAAMPNLNPAEISLAASNRLRGLAKDVEAAAGWDVRGYQPHGWKVVDSSTPRGQKLVFWIVTKPDDEQWQDSSGRSINYGKPPVERLHVGQFGSWSASMKATHWQHEYNYGRPSVGRLPGEEKPEP